MNLFISASSNFANGIFVLVKPNKNGIRFIIITFCILHYVLNLFQKEWVNLRYVPYYNGLISYYPLSTQFVTLDEVIHPVLCCVMLDFI